MAIPKNSFQLWVAINYATIIKKKTFQEVVQEIICPIFELSIFNLKNSVLLNLIILSSSIMLLVLRFKVTACEVVNIKISQGSHK